MKYPKARGSEIKACISGSVLCNQQRVPNKNVLCVAQYIITAYVITAIL